MSKFTKLISVTIVLVMLSALLTSCTKTSNATPAPSQGGTASSYNPFGKYEAPITITAALTNDDPGDADVKKGTTPENNQFVNYLKDKMNINLKIAWSVPAAQYTDRLNLSLASNDVPDIFMDTGDTSHSLLENMKLNGVLADITEVYKNYISPDLKLQAETSGGLGLDVCKTNGKLYAIPTVIDNRTDIGLLFVRNDWLKNVGMVAPKSIDELVKVADAFVNKDPDMNEKKDTQGIGIADDSGDIFLRHIYEAYGAYPNFYIKGKDGNLVAGDIQPELKGALGKLQDMYKASLFDKEFAMKTFATMSEDLVAGKVGMFYGAWWCPGWPLQLVVNKDPKADWICVPIPGLKADKHAASGIQSISVSDFACISAKCKNPEAGVKILNLYYDMNCMPGAVEKYGDYVNKAKGYHYGYLPLRTYRVDMLDRTKKDVKEALDTKDPSKAWNKEMLDIYNDSDKYLNKNDKSGWGNWFSRISANGAWATIVAQSDNVVKNEFFGIPTATMADKGAVIQKLKKETFFNIIMGKPLDATFNQYVDNWKKMGGTDILKEVNDWYAKNKK